MQNNDDLKDKDLSELFDSLKAELLVYADQKFRYFKLGAYEKIATIFSLIAFCIIVMVLAFGLLFFALFGTAFLLGEIINSFAGGFGIMFGFILIVLVIILLLHKQLRSFIMNKSILFIRNLEEDDDDEEF